MNQTTNTTSLDDILCPLDNRRTATELWVKLFIVHFTTITAFCHLLSIRGEPIVSWKLVYYFLSPWTLLVQHALAFLALFIAGAYWLFRPIPDHREQLYQAAKHILGRIPAEEEILYRSLPKTEGQGVVTPKVKNEIQPTAKRIGRMLLAIAFLVQCIGTIYIYRRRQIQGATTKMDQRVFELGCSGVLTGTITLLTVAKVPLFHKSIPDTPQKEPAVLPLIMIHLRDTISGPYGKSSQTSYVQNSVIAMVLLVARGHLHPIRTLITLFDPQFWNSVPGTPENDSITDIEAEVYFVAYMCGMSCLAAFLFLCPRTSDGPPGWACIFCPCAALYIVFPLLLAAGSLMVIILPLIGLVNMSDEIKALGEWPTNLICPQLWTDPMANWVWMLA